MRFKERLLPFAALQINPIAGDPAATLDRLRAQVRTVRHRHPDVGLVIAPELHLMAEGGLCGPEVDPADLAQPIPSPLTDAVAQIARENDLWLIPGTLYEQSAEGTYNTAVVFSPDGELDHQLPQMLSLVAARDVGAGGHRRGVRHSRCRADRARHLPRRRVPRDVPAAGLDGRRGGHPTGADHDLGSVGGVVLARANAIVNQIHVLSINAPAPTWVGRSVVVDPEGNVRYQAGATEEVITEFGMAVGLAIMVIWNVRAPAYFRNETFAQGWIDRHAPDIADDLRPGNNPPATQS